MSDIELPPDALLGMIARRHGNATSDGQGESSADLSFESAADAAASLPPVSDVTDRLRDLLGRIPADEIVDSQAFDRAREALLSGTQAALSKAKSEGGKSLSRPERLALEAVIKTDGSRPSLMLRNNAVPEDHPMLGAWRDDVLGAGPQIARAAAAVGRVEPARSPVNYFGTAFVIDDQKHLVLTNRHVLEAMWQSLREFVNVRNGRFQFLDGAYVNFIAEVGATKRDLFKVVEGMFVGDDGPDLRRLDAAVLRIRPLTAAEATALNQSVSTIPPQIPIMDAPDGALGQLSSFCAIGFPGQIPPLSQRRGVDLLVDWNWVASELMGGRHGVKRLAPGLVHRPMGTLPDDPAHWCFAHDATTLGGNSGSPILAWKDQGSPAFGLHFAGTSLAANYAHACHRIREQLEQVTRAIVTQ